MNPNLTTLRRATRILMPSLLLGAVAAAAAQEAPAPRDNAATLQRYDANRNGTLDASELDAMRADQAKAATASATGDTTASRDVVELSPFEVSGAEDRGYYASNTLSGTRINSKLEDLGSSITVVTKEQMKDFALLDVNDLFLYEAGTEGTGNFTDLAVDRNGVVLDNVAADPNNANRIRGMGAANQSRGNFATSGRVPIDPIDADAIEIARGPNSNIFGLGNSSGTVNVIPTRANTQRDMTALEFRADSYGGTRASIDLNRPLIDEKLAVRASAVFQKDEYQRKPSVSRTERYNGMVTWKPFKSTTVRGSFQYYENYARRPNSILPRDGISHWEASGSPTWNAFTSSVTRNGVTTVVPYNNNQGRETTALGVGLESGGTGLYARPSIFVEPDGTIGLWMVGRQSGLDSTGMATPNSQAGNARLVQSAPPPRGGPLWATAVSIVDQSVYDWETVNLGAPNWSENEVRNFTVELEQFFLRSPRQLLAAQLAWNREDADNYNRSFIGTGGSAPMIVYVDVNEVLPNGQPNPYFLRPYMNALEPSASSNPLLSDRYRGQLAYQLNLSRESNWLRWLGDHSVSGYAEYRDTVRTRYSYRDAIVSDHAWLAPGTSRAGGPAATRGYYRYYVGDATGLDIDSSPPAWDTSHGTYAFNWYNASTQQWVTEQATIGEAFLAGGERGRNLIKTQGLVTQNHLFRDRIVTTFGWREDVNLNRESSSTTLNPDGITGDFSADDAWPDDWLLRREGRTKTSGVVLKPFRSWSAIDAAADQGGLKGFIADAARWMTLHYNKSDSFIPSTIAQNLVGDLLPDPQGKGEDYGFSLSLFKNKLIVRYNQYENTQINSRFGDSGTIATRARRIDFSNTSGGSDRFNLYRNAREWVSQENPTWTPEQVEVEVAEQMGFPPDQLARFNSLPISDTSDVTSKGKEIEINYNPNNLFTGRVTIAQNQTIDNNLSPAIIRYIDSRMPVWQSIIDPRSGEPWFTTRYGSDSAENFLNNVVLAPYKLAVANEGKTKSQIREWRVNAFGRLNLAGLTENKWLKRVALTGAVRWEDQASIGYYTFENDPNAFDPNRRIYDEAHTYIDVGASYTARVFNDRVRMRVQLNIRNLTESGRLQPVAALPNGVPHSYRIIDPRMAILTVGFDL